MEYDLLTRSRLPFDPDRAGGDHVNQRPGHQRCACCDVSSPVIGDEPVSKNLRPGFDFFDEIRCLTTSGRGEMLSRTFREFAEIGIAGRVRTFDGSVVDRTPQPQPEAKYGWHTRYLASISHREIWRQSAEEGVRHLLVIEDDISFVDWDPLAFAEAIASLRDDWQLMFVGYILPDPQNLPPARLLNDHLLEFQGEADVRSCVCYALNMEYVDELLAYDPSRDGVVDRWLSKNLRTVCVHPLMAVENQVQSGRSKPEWFLDNAKQISFES